MKLTHTCQVLFRWLMPGFILMLIPVPVLAQECVVLLHGLARSASSMETMEHRLQQEGYVVVNVDYPSTSYPIELLSPMAVEQGIKGCRDKSAARIDFVTHSLGGILLRYYLKYHDLQEMGRAVMLGPPNHGSEVVDRLREIPGFYWINGPAGMQLGTDPASIPSRLGAVDFELGVIAGTHTINLILSSYLPEPNDGKVSVVSARIDGMRDFITEPVTHTFMMDDSQVIAQTLYFLRQGSFQHEVSCTLSDSAQC